VIRFDPPHGGYQGETIVQDEYLRCTGCGWSYPLDSMGDREPCDQCGAELAVTRAHPAPESTIQLVRPEVEVFDRHEATRRRLEREGRL
jgi:NAD-dependent SIR2 family protein deacetylase